MIIKHRLHPLLDVPMSDNIHLERFLSQGRSDEHDVSPTDESPPFCSSSDSVDNLQTSKRKSSSLRWFFQRRKRLYSSDAALDCDSSQTHQLDSGIAERRPSIDWSVLSKKKSNFLLIYRRRTTGPLIYASDLFNSLSKVERFA